MNKKSRFFLLPLICMILVVVFLIVTNKKKDIIVGTNPTFPPLEYIGGASGTEILGANVELVKLIAKDYGRDYHFDIVPFTDIFANLEIGKIDMSIGGLAISEERKKLVDFSDSYYSVSVVALVRKEDSFEGIDKETLGINKRLGTRNGSVLEVTTSAIAGDNSYETKASWALIVGELVSKRIDAVIINHVMADIFMEKYDNLEVLPMVFETLDHGIAVKKGNKKLLASINKTIAQLNASGEYQKFVDSYTSKYAHDILD